MIVGFGIGRQEVEDGLAPSNKSLFFTPLSCRDKTITIFNAEGTINDGASPNSFPLWVISLCGIPLFLAAMAHAALWKPFSLFGGVAVSFAIHLATLFSLGTCFLLTQTPVYIF